MADHFLHARQELCIEHVPYVWYQLPKAYHHFAATNKKNKTHRRYSATPNHRAGNYSKEAISKSQAAKPSPLIIMWNKLNKLGWLGELNVLKDQNSKDLDFYSHFTIS